MLKQRLIYLTGNNLMKNHTNENGFTVVEVLVTSLIFSMVAITVSAIFIQIINLERRGFTVQKNQDTANCSAATITLVHPLKGTVVYQTNNGTIQRSVNGGSFVDVSGSNVNFTRMNFCILGSLANDNQSPRITIITSVQNRTGKEILQIDLQTTIPSRSVLDEF